jgi:hypothetical protein
VIGVQQLTQPDSRPPAYFILVTGTDAPAGRPNGLPLFVEALFFEVVGKNNVSVVTDDQIIRYPEAAGLEVFDFFKEPRRIDDDSITDDGAQMGLENTGWEQRELVGFAVSHHGVARVGAPVEANNDIMLIGEEIDNFAFGLVAPL